MARNIDLWRGFPSLNRDRDFLDVNPRFNRFFDEFFDPFQMGRMDRDEGYGLLRNAEMEETDSHYLLSFDLPGVSQEDINIDVTGNRLSISAERRSDRRTGGRRGAESYQRFQQSFLLPSDVDSTKIEADCRNGVLQVAIPKGESQRSRRIEIGKGESGFFSRLANRVQEAIGGEEKGESTKVSRGTDKAA